LKHLILALTKLRHPTECENGAVEVVSLDHDSVIYSLLDC